jgi:glyoxylase-like metal-dependent hydrolase (beta-lactamase superfamily II)
MTAERAPIVRTFFHRRTYTYSHVVSDPATRRAVVIDAVLDYAPNSARTSTASAEAIVDYVKGAGLTVDWLIETHAHADHLTATPFLKRKLGGRSVIGFNIPVVQQTFKKIFNLEASFATDGSQFDMLMQDSGKLELGELVIMAMHTPGHTPACMTYVIGDAVFVGDTIFMPDYGTARCDFPGGNARTLYRSIQKVFALPGHYRVFMCHDYGAAGRDFACETTVEAERAENIHVGAGIGEDAFVKRREARDKTLDLPDLILPSVQINIRAGHLPPPEANGVSYIKLPLDAL